MKRPKNDVYHEEGLSAFTNILRASLAQKRYHESNAPLNVRKGEKWI